MTPAELLAAAYADGVTLTLYPPDGPTLRGVSPVVAHWAPFCVRTRTGLIRKMFQPTAFSAGKPPTKPVEGAKFAPD